MNISFIHIFMFLTILIVILSFRTNEEEKNPSYKHRNRDLGIYAALVVCLVTLGISRAFLFFHVMLRSSRSLHDQMFRATLRAPLRFFDTNSIGETIHHMFIDLCFYIKMSISKCQFLFVCSTFTIPVLYINLKSYSSGRILNRFSKDTGIVDDMFSFVFFDFIQVSVAITL